MSRADYAHHNEEADRIWWAEEGQFQGDPNEGSDLDDESWRDEPEDDEDEDE